MAPTEQERRDRIVAHMNREHQRQMSHYLRHHIAGMSPRAARSPTLADVTLSHMAIRTRDGAEHQVPFVPTLQSWDEIRPRLVQMDVVARAHLGGLGAVHIDRYVPPSRATLVSMAGLLFYFAGVLYLPWLTRESGPGPLIERFFPGGVDAYRGVTEGIFWSVVAIHATELVFFDMTKMQRHGVERFSKVWWQWELSVLIGGFPVWETVDQFITKKKIQLVQQQQSH